MRSQVKVEIKDESDIVAARREAREMARRVGLGTADQTRLATVVSELTRNVVQHAESGVCTISDTSDENYMRVELCVEDIGKGIEDLEKAMEDGFSTTNAPGSGLPSAKRLLHNFSIDSHSGGTIVKADISRRR